MPLDCTLFTIDSLARNFSKYSNHIEENGIVSLGVRDRHRCKII